MMRLGSALVGALMFLAGCGGISQGGSPASGLTGRTFLSTSVKGHTLAAGSTISISFPEQGKIAVEGGCNHLFGTVVAESGDKLVVTDMGGTDMGCEKPYMDQDTWLTAFLTSKPVMALQGNDLTLTSGETELKLTDRKVANPDRPLTGTKWTVTTLVQGDIASSVPQGAEAYLTFTDKGEVNGHNGCNSFSGSAKRTGDKIVFSNLGSTKMA